MRASRSAHAGRGTLARTSWNQTSRQGVQNKQCAYDMSMFIAVGIDADLCHCMFVDTKDERVIAIKWWVDLPNSSEPSFALDHTIPYDDDRHSDMKRWGKECTSP